jgi:hydrogenase/urease accessory protein HupE
MLRPFRISVTISAIAIGVALIPARAEAHLNSTGLGPIYDGAVHLLLSPEDLVSVLAIALLAGLRGARYGRLALLALPTAWLLGGLGGIAADSSSSIAATVASFLVLGALIATDARLSLTTLAALAISLGLVHGYLNGAGMGQLGAGVQALIGLTAVIFVLVAIVAAFVVQLRQSWSRIAVRVLGSWIAASGLLMLGWALHRNG